MREERVEGGLRDLELIFERERERDGSIFR